MSSTLIRHFERQGIMVRKEDIDDMDGIVKGGDDEEEIPFTDPTEDEDGDFEDWDGLEDDADWDDIDEELDDDDIMDDFVDDDPDDYEEEDSEDDDEVDDDGV